MRSTLRSKDLNKRVQAFRPGQATTEYPCTLADPNQIANYGGTDCNPGGPGQAIFHSAWWSPATAAFLRYVLNRLYRLRSRIGIAWSPDWKDNWFTADRKTSIRAGFGIFYNPNRAVGARAIGAQPPFGGSSLISLDYLQAPFASQSCTAPCTVGNNSGVSPNPFNGF